MSFIELNPDVRRLTVAAERIATALESILLHEYDVATVAKPSLFERATAGLNSEREVGYATDENTLRQELEALVMPTTVKERDGDIVTEEVGDVLGTNSRT